MKYTLFATLLVLAVTGCSQKSDTPAQETPIAMDKTKVFEMLKRADTVGTANEVFAYAAADSSLRNKMETALGIKPVHAGSPAAATKAGPKKDVLDKSSDALDVANEKVTKTGVVLDKAAQVKKKTEDILKH